MKVNSTIFLLTSLIFIFSITSCSTSDSDDAAPSNVIRDDEGIKIRLEWSIGSSVNNALSEVDLDLTLTNTSQEVDNSKEVLSFESISLPSVYQDDTYEVNVVYYQGSKSTDYTIYIEGLSNEVTKTYTGEFLASDQGLEIADLTIKKEGNQYTIID